MTGMMKINVLWGTLITTPHRNLTKGTIETMPITVDWYNADRTALIYTYNGRWTWHEFDRVVKQGNALMQTVGYTVHVIIDVREMSLIPTDVISTSNRQRISNLTPENHGKLIVYGINPALHFITSTVERIAPQWVASRNAVFMNSFEEIEDAIAWR
jgi:hypothetical protein